MDQSQVTPIEPQGGEQPRPQEEAVQESVRLIEELLESDDRQAAWDHFGQLHPADKGEVLNGLSGELQRSLLAEMEPATVASLLEFLEPEESASLLRDREATHVAQVLDLTAPDVAADVLHLLPAKEQLETLLEMTGSGEVEDLLQYRDDTAGGLMTLEVPVVTENITTPNALDQLRLLGPDAESISSVLVVNADRQLVGSLSVTRLALARPNAMIRDIMDTHVHSVIADTNQEECARVMQRYNLGRLPVVDQEGRLTGVILAEDIVDVVEEEATEDMFRIAGVGEERVMGPIRSSLRSRLPWLSINLATAFLAALMVSLFEATIVKVVALAVFLPVVASQGGIGGTQTVTLVVRSMALGDVPRRQGLRLLRRELVLGLAHGLVLGVMVGLVAFAWKGNVTLGLILGVAMWANMLVAGLAGAGVPLLLRQLRMDPAVSSAVFVTTFTDVIGFVLFLGLAATFVEFLV
jgi:magnesium transporter